MDPIFAQVVPLGAPIDRELTYLIPDHLTGQIQIGSRVLVPFGSRWATGIISGIQSHKEIEKVKEIGEILDPYPLVSTDLMDLYRWISDYYICTLSETLTTALPSGINIKSGQHIALKDPNSLPDDLVTSRQGEILAHLKTNGSATLRQIERSLDHNGIQSAVYGLIQRGVLVTFQKMVSPRIKPKRERIVELVPKDPGWLDAKLPELANRAPKQAECIQRLWTAGGKLRAVELTSAGFGSGILKALSNRNLIRLKHREVFRDPYDHMDDVVPEAQTPTPHQKKAIRGLTNALGAHGFKAYLLHGVTGSGKTLVYIHAVERALSQTKGALILVPEISLTPQTVRQFRAHFGNRVAALHSGLSAGERYDSWREVREGKRTIVIGARSAVFAPIQNLGLIIVDEEHDGSYKQTDPAPRYNARDVAVMRAKIGNFPILLGSATPALESYHNALIEKFELISLPQRIDARPLPQVTLVDMKTEGGGLFSKMLREKIRDRLEKGERIILLQNRRGYAPTVQCTDCGSSIECPNCQVTLTYHAVNKQMICHYCGRTLPMITQCEMCGGSSLRFLGVGTQKVEAMLEDQFPNIRILRLDMDTTGRKGAHDRILESFRNGKADILLGTQMVAKGLDFPGVTLVGVISADTSIHLPDFRAGERTFQLLTQVSGRAGRGEIPGEVVIQTYLPDGDAVQCAREHDFLKYACTEMEIRKSLGYPPFGRMALILFKGKDENLVSASAGNCADTLRQLVPPEVEVLGPVQAPLSRIKRTYRWQVVLKAESPAKLNVFCRLAREQFGSRSRRAAVTLSIDIDPVSML